jgi:hypothetical protein
MGTRIEDQPPEHWAGPESLDPTPVWKQFALIGIFLVLGLVLLGGVAIFAAAPQLVNPPALVPGDRLVLSVADLPAVGAAPKRFGAPLVDDAHAFWLARLSNTETVAFRAIWTDQLARDCPVSWNESLNNQPLRFFTAACKGSGAKLFNERGEAGPGAPRGLDRYLVSVTNDRVIVNLSRLIVSPERTSAPPTP